MKKLLVVIDYQNDFVNGALGFKKAKELENNIYEKVNKYLENEDYILFTYDTTSSSGIASIFLVVNLIFLSDDFPLQNTYL